MKRMRQAKGGLWRGYEQGLRSPFRGETVAERKSKRMSRRKKQAWAARGERSASRAAAAMAGY